MSEPRAVKKVLRVTVEGALLVGGHSGRDADLSGVTARRTINGHSYPIITASALKGAIREAALVLERSEPGDAEPTPMSWQHPTLRAEPTWVERVFGASTGKLVGPPEGTPLLEQTAKDRGWMEQGVRLSDALPIGGALGTGVRHGVAIDRFTRARSRARYYQKRVAECDPRRPAFEATLSGWLRDEDLRRLEDAIRLVDRLGNSASRGLGRVRLELLDAPAAAQPASLVLPAGPPPDGELWVLVEALEPLHLGKLQQSGNVRETSDFVPGGALRGALVAAARRAGRADPALAALVEAGHLWGPGLCSPSDLLPCASEGALPSPNPRTLLADKRDPTRHRADRCLSLAVARALAEGLAGVPRLGLDAGDKVQLEPVGGLHGGVPVARRLVTRLAIDPHTRGKAQGQLYSVWQIEPGARFLGTLSGVGAETWEALSRLAASGEPVFLGALRSRGLGRVRVRLLGPKTGEQDLKRRLSAYRDQAKRQLGPLAAPLGWDPQRLVQVVARTPLAAPPGQEVGAWLARELFPDGAKALGAWARAEARSGWLDHKGGPAPILQVAAPGSTWLFLVEGEPKLPKLLEAERAGIGEGRELGLGRLLICPNTGN